MKKLMILALMIWLATGAAAEEKNKYFEKEWLLTREKGREQTELFLYDNERLAVSFEKDASAKPEDEILKELPAIKGRESAKEIALDQENKEEWRVFRLSRGLGDDEYFSLLEEVRRKTGVLAVSPVIFRKGERYIILPRARVFFKKGHMASEPAVDEFLRKRFPMLSLAGKPLKEEDFFTVKANEKLEEPFLKIIDLLAQEIYVSSAWPEILPLTLPFKAETAISECQSSNKNAGGIFSAGIGERFCYYYLIEYDPEMVELKTGESLLANLSFLPFHQPDLKNYPLMIAEDSVFKKEILAKKIKITVAYPLRIYDSGDFFLEIPAVEYVEKEGNALNVFSFSKKEPVKVISQIHAVMEDLEPLFSANFNLQRKTETQPKKTAAMEKPLAAMEKPLEVKTMEKLAVWLGKNMIWLRSFGLFGIIYLIFGFFFTILALTTAANFGWPAVKSAAITVYYCSRDRLEKRTRFKKTVKRCQTLLRSEQSMSREDWYLELRQLLKRFYEEKIPDFKGLTNDEILAEIKELEKYEPIFRSVAVLFDREIALEDFKRNFAGLLKILTFRRSFFR